MSSRSPSTKARNKAYWKAFRKQYRIRQRRKRQKEQAKKPVQLHKESGDNLVALEYHGSRMATLEKQQTAGLPLQKPIEPQQYQPRLKLPHQPHASSVQSQVPFQLPPSHPNQPFLRQEPSQQFTVNPRSPLIRRDENVSQTVPSRVQSPFQRQASSQQPTENQRSPFTKRDEDAHQNSLPANVRVPMASPSQYFDDVRMFLQKKQYGNPLILDSLRETGFSKYELLSMRGLDHNILATRFGSLLSDDRCKAAQLESLSFAICSASSAEWALLKDER
ncbi:hypothetical protein CVT25_002406 [Psilocybe cyanescens]|uniref:Uncharacterized protein n=1 Tax=Psilocybe cyanescens TaxID=93625 RepID=A0A409WKI6_PSICY|nr:hypothetical protein CVT25_002406 [Psilocybe cyanescens]